MNLEKNDELPKKGYSKKMQTFDHNKKIMLLMLGLVVREYFYKGKLSIA